MNDKHIVIHLQELIAHALIELHEQSGIEYVTVEQIKEYGETVERVLNCRHGISAIFMYSDVYLKECLHDYAQYFDILNNKIFIRPGSTLNEVREHILSYTSFDVLNAMVTNYAMNVLGLR